MEPHEWELTDIHIDACDDFNPASGLAMVEGTCIDIAGNYWGFSGTEFLDIDDKNFLPGDDT